MRYGRSWLWVAASACLVAVLGCGKKAGQQIDPGRFEGSVYHNDYLGFEITIPTEWTLQDRETAAQMMRVGEKVVAAGDENVRAALEAGASRTLTLFTAFQHPQGAPVESNPSISCVAEGVAHLPGIQTGADYLFHAKRMLQAGSLRFSFPREVYVQTVAGVEFHVLATELVLPPAKVVKNEYLAALRKGYVLLMILKYSTDEERQLLQGILDTVHLKDRP
ncbi:MAG: hypothetical protein KBE65_21720 [Phycisphaerae bacterium]|nr:hypothetical protein [Phycisphaerae bacterium]